MVVRDIVEQDLPADDVIAQTRAGSEAALARLYHAYAPVVHRVAFRLCGSLADAEDITHDVFLGLPEALQRYEERGSFEPWLKRIAARLALTRLRQRTARAELPVLATLAKSGSDPVDAVALERAIAELPESLRIVFVLHAQEGYPHDEIGRLLGISLTASQVRLSRAMKRLRNRLRTD